jgi:hypothetical protein
MVGNTMHQVNTQKNTSTVTLKPTTVIAGQSARRGNTSATTLPGD